MKKFFINTIYINLFLTLILAGIIAKIIFYNCKCCNKSKCSNKLNENMNNMFTGSITNNLTKNLLGYSSFTNNNNNKFLVTDNDVYNNLHLQQLNSIDLMRENLNYFYKNKFDSSCCLNSYKYSSSNGCLCLSPEQEKILHSRANNNTIF